MPCGISGDSLNEKDPTGPPFNGDLFEFGVSFSAESFGTSTGSRERPRRCTSDIEKEESTSLPTRKRKTKKNTRKTTKTSPRFLVVFGRCLMIFRVFC